MGKAELMARSKETNVAGPYILWIDNGYKGWTPASFATLTEALQGATYGSPWVITKVVDFEVVEKSDN